MPTIESIRSTLRKQCSTTAGEDGEKFAENWLANSGWTFEKIAQGKCNLAEELKKYGGKRPDYLIEVDSGSVILADAKYHSTEDCTKFTLTDGELGKYRSLAKFCEDSFPDKVFDVVFMLFPKECDGNKFVWVHLCEFDNGTATTLGGKPATEVDLSDRGGLWCENA
ncbi:UNVERIFIED_ORG: hypothetical protein DFO82_2616 [Idiomarina abyssalis]|uniref:hypothetical protein n=1 Tax=unclassified Idiomarina TaxID=2614829 RepID=UPI000E0ED2B5|nr:hypothetical protein [Idiomarina sp. 017G]TDO45541.1 hypothetical protein DEU30_1123 [Idiomarina sp. 017G]